MKLSPFCLLVLLALTGAHQLFAQTQEPSPTFRLADDYGNSFLAGKPYIVPGDPKKDPKKPTPLAVPSPSAAAPTNPQKEAVTVEFLRKNYPILEQRAIDNPDDKNALQAYLYTRRIILDKSENFAKKAWDEIQTDPLLSENSRIPLASSGALQVANIAYWAQEAAMRELAALGGLFIFVDSTCTFCEIQMPLIQTLKNLYGLEYLVVSLDGKAPKGYKGALLRDNGMYKRLGLRITPSLVFVPRPKSFGVNDKDPNRYLIVSQGYYALTSLVKNIAFAGHREKLLSAATSANLTIWDKGVTSSQDLAGLRLDPNDPAGFKKAIEPLISNSYK
jgi:conjugal transfer pilus assembly protein TraF